MKHTLSGKLAVAAATISVVALSGAGLALASPSAATTSGAEHFYLMTTQPSASRYTLIATGAFTGYGTDIAGSSTDTARVHGGSFKIHHGGKFRIIKESVNPRTCVAVFEASAKFTLGGGTGAYKKLTGSGTAVISELAIAPRAKNGTCNLNANPVVNEETITATGHVRL